jgi:4-nitrophenyl phosphatase
METSIRAIILDIDGVIWRNKVPIGDLEVLFTRVVELGIKYAFATNNSTKTTSTYLELLTSFGVPVSQEQLFTSGSVTADTLKAELSPGSELFVIGMPGLITTLKDAGFSIGERNPAVVVVGLDEHFTYQDVKVAADFVRDGIPFIGTNPDAALPTPQGLNPGTGSILAAIEVASGVSPIIIGKPQPTIFENALRSLKTDPTETLVVGDRLSTDIAGGQAAGCKVACVLSGVTTRSEADSWSPPVDFIAKDLTALIEEIYA